MTWLFICVVFHSILSVDYRNTPVLKRIQGCWEIQSLCGDSGGDRQLRVEKCAATGPALAARVPPSAQAHGKLGNASNSLFPGQMQLVLLAAGQGERWWCAQFTAFLHMDTGTKWQGRAPEHLEADSCGHYPPWFQLLPRAHESLPGEAFMKLAWLKRIYKWLQVCCSSMIRGHYRKVLWQ